MPAVAYLRRSTDKQEQSIDLQALPCAGPASRGWSAANTELGTAAKTWNVAPISYVRHRGRPFHRAWRGSVSGVSFLQLCRRPQPVRLSERSAQRSAPRATARPASEHRAAASSTQARRSTIEEARGMLHQHARLRRRPMQLVYYDRQTRKLPSAEVHRPHPGASAQSAAGSIRLGQSMIAGAPCEGLPVSTHHTRPRARHCLFDKSGQRQHLGPPTPCAKWHPRTHVPFSRNRPALPGRQKGPTRSGRECRVSA